MTASQDYRWERVELKASTLGKLQGIVSAPSFRGVLPADTIEWCCANEELNAVELLGRLLPWASSYAFVPVSNFRVGALLRGTSGNVYCGTNIEFADCPLGFSIHGEQCAFANAYNHGESGADFLCVSDAPCGHCRQFMHEFCDGAVLRIKMIHPGGIVNTSLAELLPHPFGPSALGESDTAFSTTGAMPVPKVYNDNLAEVAAAYAKRSYNPYSKRASGAALKTTNAEIFAGSYIENVAYNPSLPAFQSAVTALVLAGRNPADISEAVLHHSSTGATVAYEAAKLALKAVAPKATISLHS